MHPRNMFKDGVSFTDLAEKYDFFRPFVIQDTKSKKGVLNFDDDEAVRALNQAILREYFNLTVVIPQKCLIPRIPLRLNYILWIEDLLADFKDVFRSSEIITGLDIGTGPCAIYALLAARTNSWSMCGTDINYDSVKAAETNVRNNNLQERVRIYQVSPTSFFTKIQKQVNHTFDFSMCNPPFFSDAKDDLMRPEQASIDWEVKSGIQEEIICPGSEVNFVEEMVKESSKNRHVSKIFTTMVGVKKHLSVIIQKMKKYGVSNFTTCIFQQGRTSRWGLAWSWEEAINLTKCSLKRQKSIPMEGRISNVKSFQSFITQLVTLLKSLEMKLDCRSSDTIYVSCQRNTWSHSRRKRRMELRANTEIPGKLAKINELPESDKLKRDHNTPEVTQSPESLPAAPEGEIPIQSPSSSSAEAPLNFKLVAVREGVDVLLKLEYLSGSMGKDAVHQVLQYLKNHPFS